MPVRSRALRYATRSPITFVIYLAVVDTSAVLSVGLIIGITAPGGHKASLLGSSLVSLVCYHIMVALGEMGVHLLHKRGFVDYAIRSVGPAFGFALGWNYLVKHLIATANSTNTVGAMVNIG